MLVYLDTSAYAKKFVNEKGSNVLEEIIFNADELAISVICIPELISAMSRKLREKNISKSQYSAIKLNVSEDISDIYIIQLNEDVIKNAIFLLEKNVLRALDALQISCAVDCKADLFVTSDKRQIKAAKNVIKNIKLV